MLLEQRDHALGTFVDRLAIGVNLEVRRRGRLVRIGDAGEVRDLAGECLLVQAFDVAFGDGLERRVDEDLEEGVTGVRR